MIMTKHHSYQGNSGAIDNEQEDVLYKVELHFWANTLNITTKHADTTQQLGGSQNIKKGILDMCSSN